MMMIVMFVDLLNALTQNASTVLRVPARCEETSVQRSSEGAGAERRIAEIVRQKIPGPWRKPDVHTYCTNGVVRSLWRTSVQQ